MAKGNKHIHQLTSAQFEKQFPTDDACKAYLAHCRWPSAVICPRCGHDGCYALERAFHWQCQNCSADGYRFSVLVGTIFENTNVPMRNWFKVIHLMLTSKKGMSALQIYRFMGFGSYKTAWYMCHRVRAGLQDKHFRKLMGIVEVDETYMGGKGSNRHGPHNKKTGVKGKTAVIGAVQRKGNVVCRVLEKVSREAVNQFIREAVSEKVSLLATDEHASYRNLYAFPQHRSINHSVGQYVVGAVHTNTIEGFWSILKRSVVGTFHKVSDKYLPLYVAEFQFRYNHREDADIFGEAIRGC